MLSILDLQSVLEDEMTSSQSAHSAALDDVDCSYWQDRFNYTPQSNHSSSSSSSSSLFLMHNVSMTQPITPSTAAPSYCRYDHLCPSSSSSVSASCSSSVSAGAECLLPSFFQSTSLDFDMLLLPYDMNVNVSCDLPLLPVSNCCTNGTPAVSSSDSHADVARDDAGNYPSCVCQNDAGNYPSYICDEAAPVVSAVTDDSLTTLSMTVQHYSSASAALNADVTAEHVTRTDNNPNPNPSCHRTSTDPGCHVPGPNCQYASDDCPDVMTSNHMPGRDPGGCQYASDDVMTSHNADIDTNALFQQLLCSTSLLDELELDYDNGTFLDRSKCSLACKPLPDECECYLLNTVHRGKCSNKPLL